VNEALISFLKAIPGSVPDIVASGGGAVVAVASGGHEQGQAGAVAQAVAIHDAAISFGQFEVAK
jgi:hypothetical protein